MIIRKNDTLIVPGFGMMDGDFAFRVDRVSLFKVHASAGILTRWWPRADFRNTGERKWTHKDIA
jgi:hypothetical protein